MVVEDDSSYSEDHDEFDIEAACPPSSSSGWQSNRPASTSSTSSRRAIMLSSRSRNNSSRRLIPGVTSTRELVRRQDRSEMAKDQSQGHDGPRIVEQYVQVVDNVEAGNRKRPWFAFGPVSQREIVSGDNENGGTNSGEDFGDEEVQRGGETNTPTPEVPIVFRLSSKKGGDRWWSCLFWQGTDDQDLFNNNFSFAAIVVRYLNWTFRTSFTVLLIHFALSFWAITTAFAAVIELVALHQPECIVAGDAEKLHSFADAYALSWTTFSTVGYGLVYPQISVPTGARCSGMNSLTAFESFLGVLYGAIAGAILFGKISRVSSFANVEFSDPVLIRFGKGLQETGASSHHGFPILEFRILNRMHDSRGGEILNASVTCVVAIEEGQASHGLRIAAAGGFRKGRRRLKLGQRSSDSRPPANNFDSIRTNKDPDLVKSDSTESDKPTESKKTKARTTLADLTEASDAVHRGIERSVITKPFAFGVLGRAGLGFRRSHSEGYDGRSQMHSLRTAPSVDSEAARAVVHAVEERTKANIVDEGSPHVPRQIFTPFYVETPSHPFFRRAWIVRHTLDATSPLLKSKAKRMIASNHGRWPRELNSWRKIKEMVHFSQILCSFSGTSNSTGNSVYNQKVYLPEDLSIGYTFARILHKHPETGVLKVREEFLNDVHVQKGGGGEPLEGRLEVDEEEDRDGVFRQAADQLGAAAGTILNAGEAAAGGIARGLKSVGTSSIDVIAKNSLRRRTLGVGRQEDESEAKENSELEEVPEETDERKCA